jgi:phage baseplate assembly protein W
MSNSAFFFKDLPLNITPNPVTGDIPIATNEMAVKKSLINLLRTPIGSRPFNPEYGTRLYEFLFNQADTESESDINNELNDVITKYEPRVKIISITTNIEDYGIDVSIDYYVVNIRGIQTLSTTITRTS